MNSNPERRSVDQPAEKRRRPYHAPRIEDYGAVNELTRSAPFGNYNPDGTTSYTSVGP